MIKSKLSRAPVHLWVYNHPPHGISDQVEFFLAVMKQNGHDATVGRRPRDAALNVVIENFSDVTSKTLIKFCVETGKRVSVIMTEHLDFIGNEIYIHGDRLWSDNDYMHPATQIARIRSLMDASPYIRSFLVLGDLPRLVNMSLMLPRVAVKTLPFPVLTKPEPPPNWTSLPADLIFTGAVTQFRGELLDILRTAFTVENPDGFLSRKARDRFSQNGRLVVNIPQRRDWRWLSLMRIIAALRCGRATISLGSRDDSEISKCCLQIDIEKPGWVTELSQLVAQGGDLFETGFADYHFMADEFQKEHPFPADFFDYWAVTEL